MMVGMWMLVEAGPSTVAVSSMNPGRSQRRRPNAPYPRVDPGGGPVKLEYDPASHAVHLDDPAESHAARTSPRQ